MKLIYHSIIVLMLISSTSGAVPLFLHNRMIVQPLLFNDQSTPSQTTIYVTVASGKHVVLYWGDGSYIVLTADGNNHSYQHDYSAGSYIISVSGDTTSITDWRSYSQSFLSGDVKSFSVITSLTYLHLSSTSVSGDIGDLAGLTGLVILYSGSTSVSGDISDLAGLTSLTYLYLGSTSVSGDIGDLAGLTGLTYLHLSSTSVSGDIGDLAGLTSLTYLRLGSTSVSGDIGDLAGLTSLTVLYLHSTSLSYGSVALPAWAGNNIQIYSCGLDSTEVDNFLIDLADGVGANGTLNIAGTNAARTAASDAAKAALIAAGWSVTVNE